VTDLFDLAAPHRFSPVIVSVPHAGRDYPPEIDKLLAVPLDAARALEDRFCDLLVEGLADDDHSVIAARAPRLLVDLNRAETDMVIANAAGGRPTWRARGGLGVIPDRLHGVGRLWKAPVDAATLADRVATVHRPYHAAIDRLLRRGVARHGFAVLIDLHSMPPLALPHRGDVVIGTLRGRSTTPTVAAAAIADLEAHRLRVAVDAPYAGGYILERHGRPSAAVHALQVEIDRRLYLDAELTNPGPGIDAMRRIVRSLADALARPRAADLPIAAE